MGRRQRQTFLRGRVGDGPGTHRQVPLGLRRGLTTGALALLVGAAGCTAAPAEKAAGPETAAAREEASASTSTESTTAAAETPGPSATAAAESEQAEPTVAPRPTMPDLVGLSRKDAKRALLAAGIAIRETRRVPSAPPSGVVTRQARAAGTTVRPGTGVVLFVTSPYPRLPDVVGQAQDAAGAALRAAGFTVVTSSKTVTSGTSGEVLQQTPRSQSRVAPGSTVTLVVAKVVRPVAPPPPSNCTAGYDPCLPPASDYDCAGGSGDGPGYAQGPVYITGSDPYDLDNDGDGVACES